jgi:streptomycin 6-kinase
VSSQVLLPKLLARIQGYAREWRLEVADIFETETSAIAFVDRGGQPLVLKLVKCEGDEWYSGEVLDAFEGQGIVRVYEYDGGAMLIERLRPGNSLVGIALNGKDEEATEILGGVMQQHSPREIPRRSATVADWGKGFERYVATGDDQIPMELVEAAQRVFLDLSASQRNQRLLHGDLQHYNVLFDAERGWLAIDPKGVVGEAEYEIGAMMRNPVERPEVFLSTATIERRLRQLTERLNLDFERALGWAFAQAVLSAIWEIEDGFSVQEKNSSLRLARAIHPMLAG